VKRSGREFCQVFSEFLQRAKNEAGMKLGSRNFPEHNIDSHGEKKLRAPRRDD